MLGKNVCFFGSQIVYFKMGILQSYLDYLLDRQVCVNNADLDQTATGGAV